MYAGEIGNPGGLTSWWKMLQNDPNLRSTYEEAEVVTIHEFLQDATSPPELHRRQTRGDGIDLFVGTEIGHRTTPAWAGEGLFEKMSAARLRDNLTHFATADSFPGIHAQGLLPRSRVKQGGLARIKVCDIDPDGAPTVWPKGERLDAIVLTETKQWEPTIFWIPGKACLPGRRWRPTASFTWDPCFPSRGGSTRPHGCRMSKCTG
jgi:hypothetical protein